MTEIQKKQLSPVIVFILLCFSVVIFSGLLSLIGIQSEYTTINTITNKLNTTVVSVNNLFSTTGIKNIVVNTVNYFMNFGPLSMLLIILIGFGILEKSGFLKVCFTFITRHARKNTTTFLLVLICLLASILGDISYIIMIPLSALLFKYGKRNPLGGVIVSFASLSFGSIVNVLLTNMDSSLMRITQSNAKLLDINYSINPSYQLFIMIIALIAFAIAFTQITEKVVMPKLGKVNDDETTEIRISNKELRGLIVGIGVGILYLLVIVYCIVPGLPLSGVLLDESATLYIDKLLGVNSLFSQGFIFIITIFFILVGLFYGIFAKTIKNTKDVTDSFGASLDGIGNIIVLIFFASIFINIFELSNIGTAFIGYLSSALGSLNFTGIPLIIVLFVFGIIACIFCPSTIASWSVMSGSAVPLFMNASISPEFAQVVFNAGTSVVKGIVPLFSFFIIYLAFAQKYENREGNIFVKSIKNLLPYVYVTAIIWFILLVGWYIIGLPIGIATLPGVTYVS